MPVPAPFPAEAEPDGPAITELKRRRGSGASGPWRLVAARFLRQRVATAACGLVLLLYLVGAFAEFLAPGVPDASKPQYGYAPPQPLHLLAAIPHAEGYRTEVDRASLRRTFVPDDNRSVPVGWFVQGAPYRLWGLVPMTTHLFGPLRPSDPFFLLGADRLGRDLLTRLIYGTRVSMSIGLAGVATSLVLGVVLGALAGFYGGWVDTLIGRVIEVVSAMPTIPLWLGLAAAIPLTWSPVSVYFVITLIVSLLGWTSLAREVRGRFLALRTEDFVLAARLDGAGQRRVIFRHILPSLTSHILAVVTLAVPTMIVAETSLSFLGIGLKPPVVSWGVLLQDAQNIRTVATAPWLLAWPAGAVVLAVLGFNFLGDGLRDAADPYGD